MVATEALKKDHRLIERMLDLLQSLAKKFDQGGDVPADSLKNISGFIKTFADNYHHGKEEELLFKAMEERGFPREGGPIGVMLIEHDEGRGYTRALAEVLRNMLQEIITQRRQLLRMHVIIQILCRSIFQKKTVYFI